MGVVTSVVGVGDGVGGIVAAVVIVPADGVTAGVMGGVTVGVTMGVTAIDPPVLLPVPSIGFNTINAPPAITRIAIIIAAIVIPMRFFDAGPDAGAGGVQVALPEESPLRV